MTKKPGKSLVPRFLRAAMDRSIETPESAQKPPKDSVGLVLAIAVMISAMNYPLVIALLIFSG